MSACKWQYSDIFLIGIFITSNNWHDCNILSWFKLFDLMYEVLSNNFYENSIVYFKRNDMFHIVILNTTSIWLLQLYLGSILTLFMRQFHDILKLDNLSWFQHNVMIYEYFYLYFWCKTGRGNWFRIFCDMNKYI